MSGVCLTRHGGPDALQWRTDIPVPRPGPGQALVEVLAAGVNNTDINTRIGWYAPEVIGATDSAVDDTVEAGGWSGALQFPRIQGGDLCGRVVALGAGVAGPKVGARVTLPTMIARPTPDNPVALVVPGSEFDGAFAQFCRVEAADLFDVSASPLSDIEIGAMPCAFGTALNLLTRAGVVRGQRVLVTGASGGVGLAAVQLAALRGAEVTAQASAAKAQAVRDAGAARVQDRDADLPRDAFDAVIDVVGGPRWPDVIQAVRPGGHYAVSGAIAGPLVTADLREIYLRDITLHGCTFMPRAVFADLVDLINAGTVRPLVSNTYPLARISEAQDDFLSKRYPGKLVLIPPKGTE
jgi:alcohol dehydrogenase